MSASVNQGAPERDPETMELFIDESLEAFQRIERLLLDAEEGHPAKDLMAVLFRHIHTVKGSSGFLALGKISALSHAAEDLLSRLRDGTLAARPEHFTCLMMVIDALRQMTDRLRATNDEGPTEVGPLIAQLVALAEGSPASAVASDVPVAAAPAVPAPEHVDDAAAERKDIADGTVRVNVAVLDRLMNLIGELVLARNQIVQMVKTARDSGVTTQAACQRLSLVTSDLQEQIMKTRMQPVGRVFEKIPRMVRDLSRSTGKQVNAQIEGTGTEIDKALVEAIRDPVMHIVRNAMDHGIETPEVRVAAGKPHDGRLTVRASHEGGMVTIEVQDDGKGMDPKVLRAHAVTKGVLSAPDAERLSDREALDLVFRAGFSTATKVTDISGRGVGMDVVRTHVERAGGQVELESVVGQGSTVRLKMPLTLAIIPALLVETGQNRFAIPQVNLLELVYLEEEQARASIEHVRGAAIYRLRGEILPLVHLGEVLKTEPAGAPRGGDVSIVVVAIGARRYGLVVDHIHDTEEIVIKPLSGQLKRLSCYSGATVLGDGGVALILDVAGIAAMAGIDMTTRKPAEAQAVERGAAGRQQAFVVFTAGDGCQCAVPLAMVARLERIALERLEHVGGNEVVQYRESIMPIVRPESVLSIGASARGTDQPVLVFDFGQMVGMAVSAILDIVELKLDPDAAQDASPYTLGKTVVFGKTTLLIDVYQIVRTQAANFVSERRRDQRRPRILVADDSNAMRAALSGYLRAIGTDVCDVASGDAALCELRRGQGDPFDAVITDLEMEGTDGLGVVEAVRRERPTLPVLVWTHVQDPRTLARVSAAGAVACVNKLHREELVTALETAGVIRCRRADDRRAA